MCQCTYVVWEDGDKTGDIMCGGKAALFGKSINYDVWKLSCIPDETMDDDGTSVQKYVRNS